LFFYGQPMARGTSAVPWLRLGGLSVLIVAAVAVTLISRSASSQPAAVVPAVPTPTVGPPAVATPALPILAPPADLPVVTYWPSPSGFPADPSPLSTAPVTEGLRPDARVAAYDAPGGQPRAYLDPTIRGVPITLPIVERQAGWAGVLLPSVNRTVAWVPPGPWTAVALRDQLVVVRGSHELYWFRDSVLVHSWPVTLGIPATPTPLGRTFILGRSTLPGYVYAGTDVFALAAVPDRPDAVPPGLRGAHIGLHTWYNDRTLGLDNTDGCIRLTRTGQQLLLAQVVPGTEVVVLDAFRPTVTSGPTP
jgi:hypothetical protein